MPQNHHVTTPHQMPDSLPGVDREYDILTSREKTACYKLLISRIMVMKAHDESQYISTQVSRTCALSCLIAHDYRRDSMDAVMNILQTDRDSVVLEQELIRHALLARERFSADFHASHAGDSEIRNQCYADIACAIVREKKIVSEHEMTFVYEYVSAIDTPLKRADTLITLVGLFEEFKYDKKYQMSCIEKALQEVRSVSDKETRNALLRSLAEKVLIVGGEQETDCFIGREITDVETREYCCVDRALWHTRLERTDLADSQMSKLKDPLIRADGYAMLCAKQLFDAPKQKTYLLHAESALDDVYRLDIHDEAQRDKVQAELIISRQRLFDDDFEDKIARIVTPCARDKVFYSTVHHYIGECRLDLAEQSARRISDPVIQSKALSSILKVYEKDEDTEQSFQLLRDTVIPLIRNNVYVEYLKCRARLGYDTAVKFHEFEKVVAETPLKEERDALRASYVEALIYVAQHYQNQGEYGLRLSPQKKRIEAIIKDPTGNIVMAAIYHSLDEDGICELLKRIQQLSRKDQGTYRKFLEYCGSLFLDK